MYVGAVAPGWRGGHTDARRSGLKNLMTTGVFKNIPVTIDIGPVLHEMSLYLVGDSAFIVTKYMQACLLGQHAESTSRGRFIRESMNDRRSSERVFRRFKGRWQFFHSN